MGNYLRSVADRMVGTSRLRPRVPSLFEPHPPSGGQLVAGSAATAGAWSAAAPPSPARFESEAAVEAGSDLSGAASNIAPARRDATRNTTAPPRLPPQPETRDGVLRPPTTRRLEPQPQAAPARQAAAPTVDTEAASSAVAASSVAPARSCRSTAAARGEPGLGDDLQRQAIAPPGETALSPRSQTAPQFVAPLRQPLQRLTPAEDASNRARETAIGAVADEASPRPHAAPSVRLQPAAPAEEAVAPTVNVVIGKITVQANVASAPAPHRPRPAAPAGPQLSLEQYLLQRRGGG